MEFVQNNERNPVFSTLYLKEEVDSNQTPNLLEEGGCRLLVPDTGFRLRGIQLCGLRFA
jgi:hypothetical protein